MKIFKCLVIYLVAILAAGLLYGFMDANDGRPIVGPDMNLIFVSLVFGILYPRLFLLSSFLLPTCLYAVHCYCIVYLGYKQPYVEASVDAAALCYGNLFESILGCGLGAGLATVTKRMQKWQQNKHLAGR